jgi:hypothetical protein
MNFNPVNTTIGIVTLLPMIAIFLMGERLSPLGAMSLPCLTMLTSFIYFYLMPVVALAGGDNGFFGMYVTDLFWTHIAVLLYAVGAGAAFVANQRKLNFNPANFYPWDRDLNRRIYLGLWGLAALGVLTQSALGKLNLFGVENYEVATENITQFAFVTQAYNMMLPLALIFFLRNNFKLSSLLVFVFVMAVFLQAGFRFRIMILLAATVTAFALTRSIKLRTIYAIAGIIVALVLVNVIGAVRRYGQGIDLSNLSSKNLDVMSDFGGEFGTVYVLNYIADNPLPSPVTIEPWVVAFARLVPSFLWPEKPTADYTQYFISGATVGSADMAGIAAPQHVEMLLQFGWFGMVPLAFLYFSIAALLVYNLSCLGREARIAGCSMVPSYFGFYMQSRGYFFQIFADALFTFGPLFVMHIATRLPATVEADAWGFRRAITRKSASPKIRAKGLEQKPGKRR